VKIMNSEKLKRIVILGMVLATASLSLPVIAQSHSGGHSGGQDRGAARAGGGFHGGGRHGDGGWHRGGPAWWGVGLGLGLGWELSPFDDPYYPYPGYAYPPPPAIVEQPAAPIDAGPPTPQQSNWYYCDSAKAYYPYVKECPEGWRTVPAAPPGPPQ
jgi:hypothetical protein